MFTRTATQQSEPIVVEIVSGGTPWWEIVGALGPFAVLVAAVLTFGIAFATLKQRRTADDSALEQKRKADDRSEWWRRTQWALDASASRDRVRQTAGLRALRVLATSELATKEEKEMLDAAWSGDEAVNPDSRRWTGRLYGMGRQLIGRDREKDAQ
ncbi:hypothetical protein [Arthrobacter sp. H41]|uniref:hypothetical protein n=1 Tax=Arthrobacter sp. H41 TaxID=1312978 RepID=UPI0006768ADB|nr:hypothetical protein [Arthrobacter sp. H41]